LTYLFIAGVQPHVHVLLPGPGIGHPAGGQRLAAQGRHRVSCVRGVVRRRVGRQQVQATVGRATHRTVSPRTASLRRHGHSLRHGRSRGHHGNRRHAVTHDLDVNKQRYDNIIIYRTFRFSLSLTLTLFHYLYLSLPNFCSSSHRVCVCDVCV